MRFKCHQLLEQMNNFVGMASHKGKFLSIVVIQIANKHVPRHVKEVMIKAFTSLTKTKTPISDSDFKYQAIISTQFCQFKGKKISGGMFDDQDFLINCIVVFPKFQKLCC